VTAPGAEEPESISGRAGLAIGLGLLVITGAAFVRPPLLPEMGRDLDLTATGLGALGSVFALGRIITDVPAGRLTDHQPVGTMMAIGAGLVAAGSLASGVAPIALVAFAGAFILGIGSAWTNTTAMAAFATAPRHRRGMAMSGFAAGLLVGQAIGPTLGGGVGQGAGWRIAFGVAAGLAAVVAVAMLAALPRQVAAHERSPRAGGESGGTGAATPSVLAVIYLLPAMQFALGGAILLTLAPIVGDAELGLDAGVMGLVLGIGGILRLIGALAAGKIADGYSRRWALIPGLFLQLAGVMVFAYVGNRAGWVTAIALMMLGSVGVNVGATVLADLTEGSRLGNRLGVFRLTGDVALLIAPVVVGALYEVSDRALASLPMIIFSVVVIVAVLVLVPETVPRRD
jgi:predicted MFS family arabinose efflux permease